MLRSVARDGGQLRLTVLGPAGTVEGFDALWEAAFDVVPGLAPPAAYAHHRFGDVSELHRLVTTCEWEVADIVPITSVRTCTAEELWRWLWGSLPLRRVDGTFLTEEERTPIESRVRAAFFLVARRFLSADRYVIRSLAHMVVASATDHRRVPPRGDPATIEEITARE